MNKTKPLQTIDACLRVWAHASRADYHHPLGYPHKNLLYGLSELGMALKTYSHQSTQLVDLIDAVVQHLAKAHPHLADALMLHYIKLPQEPLRQQAKTIHLPKSTYFDRLNQARQWVWQQVKKTSCSLKRDTVL